MGSHGCAVVRHVVVADREAAGGATTRVSPYLSCCSFVWVREAAVMRSDRWCYLWWCTHGSSQTGPHSPGAAPELLQEGPFPTRAAMVWAGPLGPMGLWYCPGSGAALPFFTLLLLLLRGFAPSVKAGPPSGAGVLYAPGPGATTEKVPGCVPGSRPPSVNAGPCTLQGDGGAAGRGWTQERAGRVGWPRDHHGGCRLT